MKRFHFRLYVGPLAGHTIADRLKAQAMPWQRFTLEGTQHVHFSIDALFREAAETEAGQWFTRAGFQRMYEYQLPRGFGLELQKTEEV